MAGDQTKCFLDISTIGNPIIIEDNWNNHQESIHLSGLDRMPPQDNFGVPVQFNFIDNLRPILFGFEYNSEVPLAELTQGLLHYNSDVNLSRQNESETQGMLIGESEGESLLESPTDCLTSHCEQTYSPQDCPYPP